MQGRVKDLGYEKREKDETCKATRLGTAQRETCCAGSYAGRANGAIISDVETTGTTSYSNEGQGMRTSCA